MKLEAMSRGKMIVFVVGTVAMALAAGAAGAALIANYAVSSLTVPSITAVTPTRPVAKVNATKVSAAVRSSVVFYKKHAGTAVLDKVFLPSDGVGAGTVLTADGWLVTASSMLAGSSPLTAVFADKTTAAVDPARAVRDEATGLSYIKTEVQHLTVAVFGDDTALQGADPVYSVNADLIVSANVLAERRLPVSSRTDYVESSERLGRRLITSKSGLIGSPVVDANGSMVGVDLGDGTAVPSTFVSEVLRDLFKDGKIVRPHIGLRFVSLDNLPNAKDAGLAATGALITGDGKYRAVEKGSPAEVAGLRELDVITMVERDRINNEETLAERLQDYVPGARVELTVMRAGEQIKVDLTLK